MPRTLRTRSRSHSFEGKIKTWFGPGPSGPPTTTSTRTVVRNSTITDWVGRPVTASSLVSDQRSGAIFVHGAVLSGTGYYIEFDSVPTVGSNFGSTDVDPLSAPNGWVLRLVAGTNPSRPNITPPEMVQNLIELPKMILNAWKFLQHPRTVTTPRGAANEYLGIKFGWIPFIKDIADLLDLQDLIDKRLKELKKLHSGKGLRRRLKFGEDTKSYRGTEDFTFPGVNSSIRVAFSLDVKKSAWATIRWKPTEPPPYHLDDVRTRARVRNIVLGLTPEGMAKGLWNVLPWTWLAGWFTNVGDYFLSGSNTVPAQWGSACFMSKVQITTSPGVITPIGNAKPIKVNAFGSASRVTRSRLVGTPTLLPGLNMPFLDMSRLSVLGALGIQRFRSMKL